MPDSHSADRFAVTTGPLPASRKVYVGGTIHPDIRVAQREIDLTAGCGEAALPVYDTSGAYSDPGIEIDIRKGLTGLRQAWIEARGDVESYEGRNIRPEDNGLKDGQNSNVEEFDRAERKPFRARNSASVTQ